MKYVHTNIIAKDWRRLVAFYQQVFGCTLSPPERDISGDWLDELTGLEGTHLQGAHLLLPSWGEDGPTLEIFQYDAMPERPHVGPNTPGIGHIAFAVDDVAAVAQRVLAHGGASVGALVRKEYPGYKTLTVQYLADPEGNILELQSWEDLQER